MLTYALCFIVFNEAQGCVLDVPRIDLTQFDQVYAVDGGSTDGTVETLTRFGVRVFKQKQGSLNAAYREAVEACECDNLLIFFPKGTLDLTILKAMRDRLAAGTELVIASRLIQGGRNEEDRQFFRPRKTGIKALALFSALVWRRNGPMVWDVLHGVKGFTKQAFLRMNPTPQGVSIDLEMVVRSYRLSISRCEVPVVEEARSFGDSRFKILPTGIQLARYLLAEITRPAKDYS
jgi:hypothetical protein